MTDQAPDAPGDFDARGFLQQLTTQPGVYRMLGATGDLLYVGKARNLKKRVSQYFLRASGDPRIESMVSQIRHIDITVTHTEDEALILEATLIKELNPRYNILYRDDKSYPYLRISAHAYPRISYYRGEKRGSDQYFGPFPSAGAVRETLVTLQKLFQLRPCRDSFFAHRDRPCLQHQIKRCSAPCVALIERDEYARDVNDAKRLLGGQADQLAAELAQQMDAAAEALEFERAARVRDQIAALRRVRESRNMTGGAADLDVIAVALHPAHSCVVVMSVRDGMNLGHRSHFPRHPPHAEAEALLESFLGQHYLDLPAPAEILLSDAPQELAWIGDALSQQAGRRIVLNRPQRGAKLRLLQMAQNTANQALSAHLADAASMDTRFLELQQVFGLDTLPRRIECFDISHTGGELAVASCVVFNEKGPAKASYRKFNIEGITPGDDYAAIKQAVMRRFLRVKSGEVQRPDLLLIDGGKGQLSAALEGLEAADCLDVRIAAVAKGPTRRAGMEEIIVPERSLPMRLPPDSPALNLIQRVRDEAHRFAITGHRSRRDKARLTSDLDQIEGLGPARKRALLAAFGGLAAVRRASVDQLAKVDGVSRTLAERIYAASRG